MSTPAGWYDDGSGRQRWWDGTQWTEHFAPTAEQPATQTPEQSDAEPTAEQAPAFTPPAVPTPDAGAYAAGQGATSPIYGAPAAAYGAPAGVPATTAKKKPHVLAWIALGAAALGFVLACIPGILIAGWILLPIALILSIVAFFLPGAKWPAITGLILAIVGGIVGVIVFVSLLVVSAQDAFGGTESTVSQAPLDDSDADDADDDAGSGQVGTRENPAPIGSTISGDDYDVVINSVNLDATDDILAANSFNDAPPEGYTYALINATVTYTGDDSGYAAMVMIDYVTSTGEVVGVESIVVPPEPVLGLQELYTDASATGNAVIAIPVDDAGLLRVTPGMFADEVFVALP